MKILVINAGSSSVKYQLINMETETVLAKGQADRIGIAGGNFKQKVDGKYNATASESESFTGKTNASVTP